MNLRSPRALLALAILALPLAATAQKKPSDYTVEDFFRPSHYSEVNLSPNGERLSALAPLKGRNNLVIIDLKTRKPVIITSFEKVDVTGVIWINNDRLCFRVADGQEVTGQLNYKGTYCINQDGGDLRDFTRPGVRDASTTQGGLVLISWLGRTYDGSPDVFAGVRLRSRDSQDVYRFNTSTGRFTLISEDNPGDVLSWVLDRNNVPRVAVSQPLNLRGRNPNRRIVWYRDREGAKWEKLWEYEYLGNIWSTGDAVLPLAFDYDNSTLYVASNVGRDKYAVYPYDTKAKKMGDVLFEDNLVDVTRGLLFSRVQKKLLGIRYDADKQVTQWVDAPSARLQRQIDATFPGKENSIALPAEMEDRALIFSQSDVDPGTVYLMDRKKPSIEPLVKTREWLDPKAMSERRFISYKARDGRTINAYVTIPNGSSGKNLPLVVNIHGGPWVRQFAWTSDWAHRPEAQFFASRGYVVLEAEPRGSTGFGKSHYESSFRQWGQTMQDDITDGALHLVKEGIVDKSRMCLHGGSYGGYATLMGLAKDPDLWKCGTPFVAVTDLALWQTAVYSDLASRSNFMQTDFPKLVGDSSETRDLFQKYSPALLASRIKAPVFLSMGSDDARVPQSHGDTFRSNMEAAGKKIEYVVYPGEGHGYNKPENVHNFYSRVEKFFAANLR